LNCERYITLIFGKIKRRKFNMLGFFTFYQLGNIWAEITRYDNFDISKNFLKTLACQLAL